MEDKGFPILVFNKSGPGKWEISKSDLKKKKKRQGVCMRWGRFWTIMRAGGKKLWGDFKKCP